MLLVPMDAPVEIRRWMFDEALERVEMTVAKGPFIIMAHGLMSLPPAARETCWIATPTGDVSPAEAAEVLEAWTGKAA